MRLWSLHPKHLDAKGLTAAWREGLLAQKVLAGKTRGYKHHPQLKRFRALALPGPAIGAYLAGILMESLRRGYRFDHRKIQESRFRSRIPVTSGQIAYEWEHLQAKLRRRDPRTHRANQKLGRPAKHPLFRVFPGPVEPWERI